MSEVKRAGREILVHSKYYFAGACAHNMFLCPTTTVIELLDKAVGAVSSYRQAAFGGTGDRSGQVVNRLYSKFRSSSGKYCSGIISQYAASALAIRGGPTFVKTLANVLQQDSYPALNGWMLEMLFFACLRKGGVTLDAVVHF